MVSEEVLAKKKRFIEFRKSLGLRPVDLVDILNLSSSSISQIEGAKYDVTLPNKAVIELYRLYKMNIHWYETGEGEMILKKPIYEQFADLKNPKKFPENIMELLGEKKQEIGVPYYDNIEVTASIVRSFSDVQETPEFFINYKHFNDCTAYFPIFGDSMYPKYASGEIVAVKQIFNMDVILWGETYLIITNEDGGDMRTLKTVHPHENDSTKIILRASNPNFRGDTVIPKDSILSIYIVKGKINRAQL